MSIGTNIRKLRKDNLLTQSELGEMVGVNQSRIAQIERDTTPVSLQLAKEIADIFKCKVDDFLKEETTYEN